MIDFDKHFIVKSKFKSLVSVIVEFLLFQYRCVMLQTVLTRAILEYLVCFAYHWHVVCFRCKVPGVMDGDEPRSFVTLYELEGLEYTRQDKTRQDLCYSAQFYRTFRLKLQRQLNTVQLRNKRKKKKDVTIN